MNKLLLKCLSLCFIGGTFLFVSCNKHETVDLPDDPLSIEEELAAGSGEKIVLGETLENPYSVSNMKEALNSLIELQKKEKKTYKGSTLKDSSEIEVTDYYVKFWVENDDQKNLLIADSLNLSIVPLDVEIVEEGNYFVDETTEIEEGQWLYTSVLKDYEFHSDIQYEIIETLFLIEESGLEEEEGDEEEDESTTTTIAGKVNISKEFLYDLEEEALRITGNLEDEDTGSSLTERKSKKKPQGYIQVYNTQTAGLDPVVGVKVKTRRWFKWAKGWTNSEGYYKVNRGYRRDVRYTVVFKNTKGFKVWPSVVSISSARYRAGKHSKYGHNINFYQSSVGWRWSTVNNAAVKYWDYCTQFGIDKPHNLRIVSLGSSGASSAPMMRRVWGIIGFSTKSDVANFLFKVNELSLSANALAIMLKLVLPDVIIQTGGKNTEEVFDTTFHELGHASHFKKVGSGYWVKYINYIITYGNGITGPKPYGDGTGHNAEYCGVGEMWGYYIAARFIREEFNYTKGFDEDWGWFTHNREWFNPGFLKDVDHISDVTTADIFSCLKKDTNTFDKLLTELKTKTEYDDQVEEAFANYTDWP